MLEQTLSRLTCPRRGQKNSVCGASLTLKSRESTSLGGAQRLIEVRTGHLDCTKCGSRYPILAGVALLVPDVRDYLLARVKGISKVVSDAEIPREYLQDFLEAKEEIQVEHIEEDLEAERVVSLYLMNHYLRVSSGDESSKKRWWAPEEGTGSPLIEELVKKYWDQGPFSWIEERFKKLNSAEKIESVVELGCGVGGLSWQLSPYYGCYLGIDSSFASIALARHLILGLPYNGKIRIPSDLLQGSVSADPGILCGMQADGRADFIVGDFEQLPVMRGKWDVSIALNAIDMLDDPALLPRLQYQLIRQNGIAFQSCPYIWHEMVSKKLRQRLPRQIRDSAQAVEWLYQREGLQAEEKIEHLPWLFFKHLRQLEIYSVHIFLARKD